MSKFGNCLICPREILMGGKVFSIKKFLPLCSLQSSTYVHTNIHIVRMLLCTDPLPVCSSSCWLDGSRVAADGDGGSGKQSSYWGQQERQRGEARGFKATGLACLAHQSPGIKCEQSCSSPSSTQLPLCATVARFACSNSRSTKSWHKVFWPLLPDCLGVVYKRRRQ